MELILHLISYISGGAAGVTGIGSDFWGTFYNGFVWYWNFYCQWGC